LILADINPVGYHAWMNADSLVLFVLGQPASLQIASTKTGKAEIVADAPGRSLHRIPGTALASYVRRDASGDYWIMQLDPATKASVPVTKAVEGSSDRDMAWMPDGKTILMSSGTKVFSWTRGDKAWTEVFDGAAHQLGGITRLSVSPKGDAVAIVVAEPKK
jgi:dipeptidyl aminopeptidase/acylaminoacyl peptidase